MTRNPENAMMRTATRVVLTCVACLPLVGAPASAAIDQATWGQRVARSEALLQEGEYEAALEVTAPLLEEMGSSLLPGERSEVALGSVLGLQALAEAGTGRRGEALWHWGVAQSFKPALRTVPLDPYGAAGEALAEHRFPERAEPGDCVLDEYAGAPVVPATDREVTPPVKLDAPPPLYSAEARASGVEGIVIVQVVIDGEGRPGAPYVLQTASPNLAYLATEAMRNWSFTPARRGGEPVAVCYNVTVSFSLGR